MQRHGKYSGTDRQDVYHIIVEEEGLKEYGSPVNQHALVKVLVIAEQG